MVENTTNAAEPRAVQSETIATVTQRLPDSQMKPVLSWLESMGCARFADLFVAHEITQDAVPHLTDSDLREIGIPLGPRRIILAGISAIAHDQNLTHQNQLRTLRRQISVLFCDIADFTDLSSTLDPEDVSEILKSFRDSAKAEIERFGGYVANYMGDGILAYFGYPKASENDAERAVRAGLAITKRIEAMNTHAALKTRTGIATGLVVVGDLFGSGRRDHDVVGKTPNLAARLQVIAAPSTVVISQATQSLTRGLFEYSGLRDLRLKGFKDVTTVYEVLGESGIQNRFEALRSHATPLIGRKRELAVLQRCWLATQEGRGQVITISGEAGIGKSRLLSEFAATLSNDSHFLLRFFGSPEHIASPFHPFIMQLTDAAGFAPTDTAQIKREKLAKLVRADTKRRAHLDTLADLLAVPTDNAPLPPQVRKDRTFATLLNQIRDLRRVAPLVIVFEDAHWIDASSLELLELLVTSITAHPIMLIVTSRPEFTPPWHAAIPTTDKKDVLLLLNHLNLGRLDQKANFALVKSVAKGAQLSDATLEQIAKRTDGVPLFIEEVTRAVMESKQSDTNNQDRSAPPNTPLAAIPVTLQDSLTARLDRLGPAVEIAQIGAVIGREFDLALLRALDDNDPDRLESSLDQLLQSRLIETVADAPNKYRFKHALLQDAAYSSLLRNRRSDLHGKLAAILEGNTVGVSEQALELHARHWARAGHSERAVARYREAAKAALSRCAAAEANALITDATVLLPKIADPTLRKRYEAELQLLKVQVITLTQSVSAPDVGPALERAQTLAAQTGDHQLLSSALNQRWSHLLFTGDPRGAKKNAEKLFEMARHQTGAKNSESLLSSHLALALIEQDLGNLEHALGHFEKARILCEDTDVENGTLLGLKPSVVVHSFQALVLFQMGYPDQARALSVASQSLSEKLEHPMSICMAHAMDSVMLFARRDARALHQCGARFQKLAQDHDIPFYASIAKLSLGAAMILQDHDRAGLALLNQGLAYARDVGFAFQSGVLSCTYLESLLSLQETEKGLNFAGDVLAYAHQTGEQEFYPELLRLKGELQIQAGQQQKGEQSLHDALNAAQKQNAKMWELRAALALGRIYSDADKFEAAQELVRPILNWFTEGFDMVELQQAKALLQHSAEPQP